MMVTKEQIEKALANITHVTDEPVTTFVMVSRATRLSSIFPDQHRAYAEALMMALADDDDGTFLLSGKV